MRRILRNKNFYAIFFVDLAAIALSLCASYLIRFDFEIPADSMQRMLQALPIALAIKVSFFFFFHIYQGMWRYTSLVDFLNVIKAVTLGSLFTIVAVLVLHRFEGYPRSVFLIDWALTLIFVGGSRIVIRLYFSRHSGSHMLRMFSGVKRPGKKLLIVGAGDTGEKVVREMLDHSDLHMNPIGFLDDNLQKHGHTIHGIPVLGATDDILSYTDLFEETLIAIPSASSTEMRAIVAACDSTGKPFRTIPSMGELLDGKISLKTVRNVTMQDLLGREEVHLDTDGISTYLWGKRVLITGAGGSIGSELVRQVSRFHPSQMALVEMSEFNLFQIEQECCQRFPQIAVAAFLVDIRDQKSLTRVFREFQPQVVLHAAAYKHVPLQELHPWEAVRNNVLGTKNLAQAAHDYGVERFVLVSTDKAVRPSNVMGATKRVAEKIVGCAHVVSPGKFMVVRFGNVLGSSGSVIPTFQAQIERGGPVTVTHPEVTRFFMSIPEAAQLILQAGAMGAGGEIFILDMGAPVRIVDLARDLIRLYGHEPERDIEIRYTGLRPGEKLYEELITEGEGIVKTEHKKILVLRGNGHDWGLLQKQIDQLLTVAAAYESNRIKQMLQEIVPEYTPELNTPSQRWTEPLNTQERLEFPLEHTIPATIAMPIGLTPASQRTSTRSGQYGARP